MEIEQPAWIGWMGSRCPVAPGTNCEVQFANGCTVQDDKPEDWVWNIYPECRDYEIIAYRVWPPAWQAQAIAAGWSPSTAHRFTREDVEKAARAHCDRFGGQGWFDSGKSHESKADMIEAMAVALSAIGEVDHG